MKPHLPSLRDLDGFPGAPAYRAFVENVVSSVATSARYFDPEAGEWKNRHGPLEAQRDLAAQVVLLLEAAAGIVASPPGSAGSDFAQLQAARILHPSDEELDAGWCLYGEDVRPHLMILPDDPVRTRLRLLLSTGGEPFVPDPPGLRSACKAAAGALTKALPAESGP